MRRALIKTVSYRLQASLITGLVALLVTGRWTIAGAISGLDLIVKGMLYFVHEILWERKVE